MSQNLLGTENLAFQCYHTTLVTLISYKLPKGFFSRQKMFSYNFLCGKITRILQKCDTTFVNNFFSLYILYVLCNERHEKCCNFVNRQICNTNTVKIQQSNEIKCT